MKAAIYEGVRSIRLIDRPKPQAAAGEAVVKVKYCGICGADVHSYLSEGQWPPGVIFGHECVGTVAELGEGVTGLQTGDRVAVRPIAGPCGECWYCSQGRPNVCVHMFDRTIGVSIDNPGGFAEYVKVKEPQEMLYRVPDSLSFEDAVLVEPLAVAVAALRQSRFRTGDNTVVVGAGVIGLLLVQLLKGGAHHVVALNRSAGKRDLALRFGARAAFDPREKGTIEKIKALCNGIGADVSFEAAGTSDAIAMSANVIRAGGQVILLGASEKELPLREMQLIVNETEIKAVQGYNEEFGLALDFLTAGRIDAKPLITDIVSLDDIVTKGFERLAASSEAIKIVVAP